VKHINKDDVEHLASVLRQDYEIDIDWEGTRYLGLTIDWDSLIAKSTFQCRDTSIKLSYVLDTNPLTNLRCNHSHTQSHCTA